MSYLISSNSFKTASDIAAAIAILLTPHAEVVLHDLSTGKIAAIWNRFSSRKEGDPSLLDEATSDFALENTHMGPYSKRETDGRLLRSITIILRDTDNKTAIGLLCINLDVSIFEKTQELLNGFLKFDQPQPEALFAKDWREQINSLLHSWLTEQNLTKTALTRSDNIDLVQFLDGQNLFQTRGATEHLANLINVSRATIYNYISAARQQKKDSSK
ncbi:MAG: PAS domain-containing protein [Sneathiella sp.]